MVWQENRATTNNVFGLLLSQSVVPVISGPVLGTRSLGDSVWGSAAGVLVSWEAVDFGQRRATVDLTRAQTSLAKNQTAVTELDVAAAAADAFLTVLAAEQSVLLLRLPAIADKHPSTPLPFSAVSIRERRREIVAQVRSAAPARRF